MRRGWYGESHRHYLASKGIKSGSSHGRTSVPVRYYAETQAQPDAAAKTAGFLKKLVEDDRPKTEDFQAKNRAEAIDKKRMQVKEYLEKMADAGEIEHSRAEQFFEGRGPFDDVVKDYLDGRIDRKQFDDRVDAEVKRHAQVYAKKVRLFG